MGPESRDLPPQSGIAPARKSSGPGRVLIAVYAILGLAATARAAFQILTKFSEAPLAYLLSAFSGLVYILATVALAKKGPRWDLAARCAILVELGGVIAVGAASLLLPQDFPHDTVWSGFGRGYLYIPLVLPVIGLWWLRRTRTAPQSDPA